MSLIIYPEYPKQLPRNYDYSVTVSQGEETHEIPVYDPSRQSNSFSNVKNADAYRRFCEFSFTGEVKVSVKTRLKMESYSVLPTSKNIESKTQGNEISFTLTQPQNLCIRLNDDKNTILAIFAEKPEEYIPNENDENVIFFKAGFNNSPKYKVDGRGVMTIPENTTVYLAPGALVGARLEGGGDNIKFFGRGAFIDVRFDRNMDSTFMFFARGSKEKLVSGIEFHDIRFLDAHCFNLCFSWVENMLIDNVKLLSNQISTDGLSFWGAVCRNILVRDTFMHITDNAFVNSSGENFNVENCIVGTDYGIFYPQGNIESMTFDNIDLFRCGDFFRAIEWANDRTWKNITVKNIRAADALKTNALVNLRNQAKGEKNIYFENISLPLETSNVSMTDSTDNTTVHFKNVYINSKPLLSQDDLNWVKLQNNKVVYEGVDGKFKPHEYKSLPAYYEGDPRIYIGSYLVPNLKYPVIKENGEWLLPKEVLCELGLERGEGNYIPLSSLENYTVSGNKITLEYPQNNKNFVPDPSFENAFLKDLPVSENGLRNLYSLKWNTFYFGQLYLIEDENRAHSGKRFLKIAKHMNIPLHTGVTFEMFKYVLKNGAGTYHIKCMAKLGDIKNPPDTHVYMGLVQGNWRIFDDDDKPLGIGDFKEFNLTDSWQEISYDVKITDPTLDGYDRCFFFIGPKEKTMPKPEHPELQNSHVMDIFVDDIEITFSK